MRPTKRRTRLTGTSFLALGAGLLIASVSLAYERTGPSGDSGEETPQGPPCAVIERFGGDVQILDATRTKLEDPRRGAGIGCGGWISVSQGWIQLKHQGGALIRLGAETFVRLKDEQDQLVLHHGEVHLTAGHGRGPIRVITPNARAKLTRGAALVVYSPEEEESQLIALEDSAEIENRFEPSRPITVKAGEGSSLNFKLLRVVPSAPRAVSIALLRKHLSGLKLEGRPRDVAIEAAQKRLDRSFASRHPVPKEDEFDRVPAQAKAGNKSYARHPASADDEFIRKTMARKVAGDEQGGTAVLHPNRRPSSLGKVKGKPEVIDTDSGDKPVDTFDAEKRRLIDELSNIKEEE